MRHVCLHEGEILSWRIARYLSSNREAGVGYDNIQIVQEKAKLGIIIAVEYAQSDNLDAVGEKAQAQMP